MEVIGAAIAMLGLLIVLSYLYHKRDEEDRSAPLIQREPLKDKGKRLFKVILYRKWVEPGRFPRRSREIERVVVTAYVWAVDEGKAIELAKYGQGVLALSRVEVIDWSY